MLNILSDKAKISFLLNLQLMVHFIVNRKAMKKKIKKCIKN